MKERIEEVTRILNYERADIQHAGDLARIVYQKQDVQYIKELVRDLWAENQHIKSHPILQADDNGKLSILRCANCEAVETKGRKRREALKLLIEDAELARDLDNVNYLYGEEYGSDSYSLQIAKQALLGE